MRGKATGIVTIAAALLTAASMWQAARAEAQSPGQSGDQESLPALVQPTTAGPDRMSLVTVSVVRELGFIIAGRGALVDSGPPKKGEEVVGLLLDGTCGYLHKLPDQHLCHLGLLLDGTCGYLHVNHIFIDEVSSFDIGIYVKDRSFDNWIQCPFMHMCRTHLQIGDPGVSEIGYNRIEAYMHGQGKEGSVGARIFGQRNLLTLTVKGTAEGNGIIFEDSARDNLVYALGLDGGFTNNAVVPTNRIITTWPIGFNVPTPPVPESGQDVMNRNPYPIAITVKTPGEVSDWTLTDANGVSDTVSAGLFAGQRIVLQPGEKIRFTYAAAPSWVWKAEQ